MNIKNLKEFKQALRVKPDIIMLDNMRIGEVRKAAKIRCKMQEAGSRIQLEASGSVNLENIRAFAQSGVDVISLGTLTKDVHSLDLSLEII